MDGMEWSGVDYVCVGMNVIKHHKVEEQSPCFINKHEFCHDSCDFAMWRRKFL